MGTRKKLKQVSERVEKIAKVINSSQANVMYSNGFILGATAAGGGSEPAAYIKSVNLDTDNQIVFTKKDNSQQTFTVKLEDLELTGNTEVENATISGDLTLAKGADFSADPDAELSVACPSSFQNMIEWCGSDSTGTTHYDISLYPSAISTPIITLGYETALSSFLLSIACPIDFTDATVSNSSDKGKYLHSNATTGEIEWLTVTIPTIATTISSSSTDATTVSPKAVYDYINTTLNGDDTYF